MTASGGGFIDGSAAQALSSRGFLAGRAGLGRGVGAAVCWVLARRAGAVCESAVARGARPRAGGRREGVRGNRETGLWGVSGSPVLAASASRRNGAVCAHCHAQRGDPDTFHGHPRWFCLQFPRSFVRRLAHAALQLSRSFVRWLAHAALHLPRSFVRWVPWRAVPDWSPWCLFTRGVEMEVPDLGHSPSRGGSEVGNTEAACSEHVSAGTRGTEPESRRTAPAPAGAALCGRCAACVMALCEQGAGGRQGSLRATR